MVSSGARWYVHRYPSAVRCRPRDSCCGPSREIHTIMGGCLRYRGALVDIGYTLHVEYSTRRGMA